MLTCHMDINISLIQQKICCIACINWYNTKEVMVMIFNLDFESDEPIYLQLTHHIIRGIGTGQLKPGDPLPTVRDLARDIGINPMTVSKAYQKLKAEGYIVIERRRGAQIGPVTRREKGLSEETYLMLEKIVSECKAKQMDLKAVLDLVQSIFEDQ